MTEIPDKVQRCFELTGEILRLEDRRDRLESELSLEERRLLAKLCRAEGERCKEAAANLDAYCDVKRAVGEI